MAEDFFSSIRKARTIEKSIKGETWEIPDFPV